MHLHTTFTDRPSTSGLRLLHLTLPHSFRQLFVRIPAGMRATIYIENISPKLYQGDYEVFVSSITPTPQRKLTLAQRIEEQQQQQQHTNRKHGRSKPSAADQEKPTEVYLRGMNLSFREWSCTG